MSDEKDDDETPETPKVLTLEDMAEQRKQYARLLEIMRWFGETAQGQSIADVVAEEDFQLAVSMVAHNVASAVRQDIELIDTALMNAMFFGIWIAEFGKTNLIRERVVVQ